jgi:hypothetical protein
MTADELRRKAGELAREHSLDGTGVPYDDETLAILRAVAGGRIEAPRQGGPQIDVLLIGGGDE